MAPTLNQLVSSRSPRRHDWTPHEWRMTEGDEPLPFQIIEGKFTEERAIAQKSRVFQKVLWNMGWP